MYLSPCALGDDVVFLDPHITQNTIDLDDEQFDDSSYHSETCARICFQSMDPSLAVVSIINSVSKTFFRSFSSPNCSYSSL